MRALTEQYRRQKSWLKETLSVFPVLHRYLKEPNGNPTGPGHLVQIRSLFLSSQEEVVCRRAPEEGEDVQHEAIPECPARIVCHVRTVTPAVSPSNMCHAGR